MCPREGGGLFHARLQSHDRKSSSGGLNDGKKSRKPEGKQTSVPGWRFHSCEDPGGGWFPPGPDSPPPGPCGPCERVGLRPTAAALAKENKHQTFSADIKNGCSTPTAHGKDANGT